MVGVKFSRFTFKGRVYKKLRVQTRRGVVAPRRQGALLKWYENEQSSREGSTLARFGKPFGSGGQWPCLGRGLDWVTHRGPFQPPPFCDSVIYQFKRTISSHFIITERGHGVSTLLHPLWCVAGSCCVFSSRACCSRVPSSELLWILCFSSVGEQCYVFHVNFNFQMQNLNFTNNSTGGLWFLSGPSKREFCHR